MLRSRTLLVVGAGASEEAGLPLGNKLREIIASKMIIRQDDLYGGHLNDKDIVRALQHHIRANDQQNRDLSKYVAAADRIHVALPQADSIDNFVHSNAGDKEIEICAKLAICSSILEKEQGSPLWVDPGNIYNKPRFDDLRRTWFDVLFRYMHRLLDKSEMASIFDNLSIVTFNYDRCIEQFFYHSIQNYFGVDQKVAEDTMEKLQIFHPFGKVGDLPWQQRNNSVEFGETPSPTKLLDLGREIKTFTELTQSDAFQEEIHRRVDEAETIVFLGMAYHKQNLDVISSLKSSRAKLILGTAYGLSESDQGIVEGRIHSLLVQRGPKADIQLKRGTKCGPLLEEFEGTLVA